MAYDSDVRGTKGPEIDVRDTNGHEIDVPKFGALGADEIGARAGDERLARETLEEQWREQVAEIIHTSIRLCDISQDQAGMDAATLRAALAQVADERLRLREIEAAMERLDAGRYGRCEQCGEAIRPERLEVLPQTRYCTTCQPRSTDVPWPSLASMTRGEHGSRAGAP